MMILTLHLLLFPIKPELFLAATGQAQLQKEAIPHYPETAASMYFGNRFWRQTRNQPNIATYPFKYGNARYPMPYNTSHFTFISDENGIANRYAGFLLQQKQGWIP